MDFFNNIKNICKSFFEEHLILRCQIKCNKLHLGSNYGGWTFNPDIINEDSIIYSLGIGEDISFDLCMIKEYNCNIFAFDPTPKSIDFLKRQVLPERYQYKEYAITDYNGKLELFFPQNPKHVSLSVIKKNTTSNKFSCRRIKTIMRKFNHTHIDILKMDIEGAEYDVIKNILYEKVKFRQLLVEFHNRMEPNGDKKLKETIKLLKENGYYIFHISNNGTEISFIKGKKKNFFKN